MSTDETSTERLIDLSKIPQIEEDKVRLEPREAQLQFLGS
jgi:hypothetical protein